MSEKTELQIVLGRDLDERDVGRKFKTRSGTTERMTCYLSHGHLAYRVRCESPGMEYCSFMPNGWMWPNHESGGDLIGLADDEPLRVGDWAFVTDAWDNRHLIHKAVKVTRIEHGNVHVEGGINSFCQISQSIYTMLRHATAAEILAANGQPVKEAAEERIEVGDFVKLLEKTSDDALPLWNECEVLADMGTHWEIRGAIAKGEWPKTRCRLISKGKKGQGNVETSRAAASSSPLASGARLAGAQPAPCPACSGSVHGPGKVSDWSDKPIACPRCQYGKPALEAPIAKPYHKMLPSGECVVAFAHDLGCKLQPTQADDLTEKLHRTQEWDRQQARKNLAKAREEAKRLGVDDGN